LGMLLLELLLLELLLGMLLLELLLLELLLGMLLLELLLLELLLGMLLLELLLLGMLLLVGADRWSARGRIPLLCATGSIWSCSGRCRPWSTR